MTEKYAVEVEFIVGWRPVSYHNSLTSAKREMSRCIKSKDFFGAPSNSYRIQIEKGKL